MANIQNMENLNPQVMRMIGREMQALKVEPLEGITMMVPDERDMTQVEAVIEGPADTPYYGGRFRVKLVICKDFPHSPPKGFFITKIFHPNVSPKNGEICVNTLKKDWKSEMGLRHVLLTVKCLLIVPNPESALNEEAGKLLLDRYDDYCSRARLYTEIHANHLQSRLDGGSGGSNNNDASTSDQGHHNHQPSANKKACKFGGVGANSSSGNSKKDSKLIKDKKKTLKRL